MFAIQEKGLQMDYTMGRLLDSYTRLLANRCVRINEALKVHQDAYACVSTSLLVGGPASDSTESFSQPCLFDSGLGK